MATAGAPGTQHSRESESNDQPLKEREEKGNTVSTSNFMAEGPVAGVEEDPSFDTGLLRGGVSKALKAPPLRAPPNSPQHSLSQTVPISIAPATRLQPQPYPPQDTTSPSDKASPSPPPFIPLGRTPPREGILSAAATLAAEGAHFSKRDSMSHSPSPSRRRPPLSPSSSSGGMTPPRMYGSPSPKPTQKGFYNPYAKNPYRVTGFVPGSPKGSKAPLPVATLSAETENELLQATERGLFSEGVGEVSQSGTEANAELHATERGLISEGVSSDSQNIAEEKAATAVGTNSGKDLGEGVTESSREVTGDTCQGVEKLGAAEIEHEHKRRKSDEAPEEAADVHAGSSPMEL